ncbi:MAG TPA: hypothetical protein VH251_10680 [Verrucomicrobiae bacterium]|jgi:hypothetical protein|nr:hypothetical protein [Verrucomicrobiae bacterium]
MGKILIAKDAAEKALAAELARTDTLARAAWKFAAGIIVVLGFQLRDIRTLVESPSLWVKVLCCLSLGILGVALILAFQGLQGKGHGHYPRGNKLWENLKPESVSEEAAQEALVQMLLQTREQSARLNDAASRVSNWCGWLFLTGVLLSAGCQLLDAFENWT